MATESIGSKEAIPILAMMLSKPGVRNHAILSYTEARARTVPGQNDTSTRNLALKELHLARALYLCGDHNGMGGSSASQVRKRFTGALCTLR